MSAVTAGITSLSGVAAAANSTDDIALVAPSDDGSQVVFMDENGGEIKTEPNPLSNPITGIEAANDSFVAYYHDNVNNEGEIGVYDYSMTEKWHDGTPSTESNTDNSVDVEITDDGSNVLWNNVDVTTVYDDSGNVVAEPNTHSSDVVAGDGIWVARQENAGDSVYAFDYSGDQEWVVNVVETTDQDSNPGEFALDEGETRSEDILFVQDGYLSALDPVNDEELWSVDNSIGGGVQYLETADIVAEYTGTESTVKYHDAETGVEITDSSIDAYGFDASSNSGRLIAIDGVNDLTIIYGDNYEVKDTVSPSTAIKSTFSVVPSWEYGDLTDGKVVDENGDAVAGATVEIWAVDNDTVSGDTFDDRVSELENLADDPLPAGWDDQGGADFDVNDAYSDSDGKFPLVHKPGAWDDGATSDPFHQWGGGELSDPAVVVEPGTEYTLSLWKTGVTSDGDGIVYSDPYDENLPGASQSGEFRVEKIGPTGETLESYTANTTETHESTNRLGQTQKTHETASVAFDQGVYRITATDSGNQYYVIAGFPEQTAEALSTQLRDESNQLTQRAQTLQDRLNDSEFQRTTVTTDENGEFSVSIPPRYSAVKVQAYGQTGDVVSDKDLLGMSAGDLRSQYENADYNGTMYLPSEIESVNPPESGVTVEVRSVDNPLALLENLPDEIRSLQDLIGSEHYENLDSLFDDPSESVDSEELQDRYDAVVKGLIQDTPLETAFVELAEERGVDPVIGDDVSRETMEAQLGLAEEVISSAEPGTDSDDDGILNDGDDGEITVEPNDDGTVTVTVPGAGDGENTSVVVGNGDGTSEVVDDENISVSDGLLEDGEITVDLAFNESDVTKQIEVVTVGEDGSVDRRSDSVVNPAFGGELPDVASLNANTLRPGVGDQVTVDAVPGDSGAAVVKNATVYAPDGTQSDVTVENGQARFTPSATGVHSVQLELESESGDSVVETVRVDAVEERTDMPPTVSMASGPVGSYALASDGVDSAVIESTRGGSQIDITARFDDGEVPDETVHVQGLSSASTVQKYTVRVTDESGSTVSDAVRVAVHTSSLSDGAHTRVDGAAVPAGSSNNAGEVTQLGGATVIHAIAENGGVEVSVNNDPGVWDRVSWWVETSVPSIPFAVDPGAFSGMFAGVVGVISVAGHRRRERRVTGGGKEAGD